MSMCGELESLEYEYNQLYKECTLLMSKYHEDRKLQIFFDNKY